MEQVFSNGIILTLGIIAVIVVVVTTVLFMIAEWRILTKAGEKGWKSLIPFYNVFVSHHIVGMSHAWFIIEVVIWIAEIIFEIAHLPDPVVIVFGVVAAIFTLASETIHIIKMCNCFGKGVGFKIGMLLLTGPFFLIIAFGKSTYKKPER